MVREGGRQSRRAAARLSIPTHFSPSGNDFTLAASRSANTRQKLNRRLCRQGRRGLDSPALPRWLGFNSSPLDEKARTMPKLGFPRPMGEKRWRGARRASRDRATPPPALHPVFFSHGQYSIPQFGQAGVSGGRGTGEVPADLTQTFPSPFLPCDARPPAFLPPRRAFFPGTASAKWDSASLVFFSRHLQLRRPSDFAPPRWGNGESPGLSFLFRFGLEHVSTFLSFGRYLPSPPLPSPPGLVQVGHSLFKGELLL